MIRRLIGTIAIVAALAIPAVAQAQGVPGGVERGSRDGERAAGPLGAIVGLVFTGMSKSGTTLPINITRMSGSARCCRRPA
jgi:hypothetical protein